MIRSLAFGAGPDAMANAFDHSATRAMRVSVVFCVAAFLLSFLLPKHPPLGRNGPPPPVDAR